VPANAAPGLKFATAWRHLPTNNLDAWELHCTVTADPPADRALIVRVSLPLDATGWTWWDNIVQHREITALGSPGAPEGGHYANQVSWDGPHEGSMYPLAAVTGPDRGVTEAIPLSEPRVYRLAYDASRHALEAEFDLGLTPDTAAFPPAPTSTLLSIRTTPSGASATPSSATIASSRSMPSAARDLAAPGSSGWREPGWPARGTGACASMRVARPAPGMTPPTTSSPSSTPSRGGGTEPSATSRRPTTSPGTWPTRPFCRPLKLKASVLKDLEPTRPGENEKVTQERRDWAQAIVSSAIERRDGSWIWHHWTDEWSPGNWMSNVS